MSTNLLELGEAYLSAWRAKDRQGVAGFVDPDIHFKGPSGETAGRETFLQACDRMFPLLRDIIVRSRFASGNQAIFTYDFVCIDPIGVCRTAELMTFQDGLITSAELFFDPRPFINAARSSDGERESTPLSS